MSNLLTVERALEMVSDERLVPVSEIEDIVPQEDDYILEPGSLHATKHAVSRILKGTGVSRRLLGELSESTRQAVLREVLPQTERRCLVKSGLLMKVYDEIDPCVPHTRLIELLRDNLPDCRFAYVGWDTRGVWEVRAVTPELCEGPDDDRSFGGVALHENGGLSVCEYIYRLVCTNGLLSLIHI